MSGAHNIAHHVSGCECSLGSIEYCVVCERPLAAPDPPAFQSRLYVDVCGWVCARRLEKTILTRAASACLYKASNPGGIK